MFAFVLDFKKYMLSNINVPNAANSEYFHISNPGLLEQELGQEQDLTVLVYESFYDG